MYGNKYDTDVTVWSPEGKLHQVERSCLSLRRRLSMPPRPRSREVLAAESERINMLYLVLSEGKRSLEPIHAQTTK